MWTIFWGVITETVLAETVTEAVPFIVPEVAIITLEWFPSTKASRYHYHHSAIELAAGIGVLGENEHPTKLGMVPLSSRRQGGCPIIQSNAVIK